VARRPVVVKVGSSTIVDERGRLRRRRLEAIATDVAEANVAESGWRVSGRARARRPTAGASYPLTVEQQTFWRRGAPVQRPVGNEGARK